MARPDKMEGKYIDVPQTAGQPFAALAAGSAADLAAGSEVPLTTIPPLFQSWGIPPAVGMAGNLPSNRQLIRWAGFVSQGTSPTVGNATNYADLQLLIYRMQYSNLPTGSNPAAYIQGVLAYYSLKINTTLGTAVTGPASNFAVTPAAMTGIVPGVLVAVDTGAAYELVQVRSTTATTFSADFQFSHTGSAAVTAVLQPNVPIPFVLANGPVNTTTGGSISAGASVSFTPGTIYGIHVGDYLLVDTFGSGVQETVRVQSVNPATGAVKATFANSHTGSVVLVTALDAQGNPRLANSPRFILQPGDVIKLTRLSNNVTGLATPAGMFYVDWVPEATGE